MFDSYTIIQWFLFFYIYSFLGWIWESCFVSFKKKKWVNRGFLNGPFLPIYGSGAVVMLIVSYPFRENLVMVYFAGLIGATILEYITGALMEALFKVRYWDYTEKRFNIKGYICLGSSLGWGVFTVLLTRFMHPPIGELVEKIPNVIQYVIFIVLTLVILVDIISSFREAMDLRHALEALEKIKNDLGAIPEKLDALLTEKGESIRTWTAGQSESIKTWTADQSERLTKRITALRTHHFRGNPTLYSRRFADELKALKDQFKSNKKK